MSKRKRLRKRLKRISIGIAVAIGMMAAAFYVYVSTFYRADETAKAVAAGPGYAYTVAETNGRLAFVPEKIEAGLIFYPGGKVEYEAYAPLMDLLAKRGILCVETRMPFNLAMLDSDIADEVMAEAGGYGISGIDWYICGHSLGGVAAAMHAREHPEDFKGIIFLASYSTYDLSDSGLKSLSVYGSNDGVLNMKKYAEAVKNFPSSNTEIVIEGGNHAQFGSYGEQKGDGTPRISSEKQKQITADAIIGLIRSDG